MSASQVARLRQIAEQMEVELITADLMDNEVLQALRAIVFPVANALKIDTGPVPLVLDAVMCHDPKNDGWWGLCATCGIVTVMWMDDRIARKNLIDHMERKHPSFEYELKEMQASS